MTSSTTAAGPHSFPSTLWSRVLAAGDPSLPQCREQMNALLRDYWKPVFAYIRAAWRKPVEDARDLTQAFFARLLEKGYLGTLRPDAGSFRGYLKTALRHFLVDAERAADARRPEKPMLSLDLPLDHLEPIAPAAGESPDDAYDRHWFGAVLEGALSELRDELREKGKEAYDDLLRAYLVEPALGQDGTSRPTYQEMAKRFDLSESDVRNRLTYCRILLRRILEQRIRNTCSSRDDATQEWRTFLGT